MQRWREKKKQVQHLKKRSKINVSEGFWDEVLPLNEADPP